jgi:hypothetical protein
MNQPVALQRAVLLFLLAVLMTAHLGMVYVGILECDAYARELLRGGSSLSAEQTAHVQRECAKIEQVFSAIADKYIAVILALLGGAVMTARRGDAP